MDDVLYREEILDHYRSSPHRGLLEHPDYHAEVENSLCGDQICFELKTKPDGTIDEVGFDGHGCAISQAAASLLAEHLEGKSLECARCLNSQQMLELIGTPLTPRRMKCGLLAWQALRESLVAAE